MYVLKIKRGAITKNLFNRLNRDLEKVQYGFSEFEGKQIKSIYIKMNKQKSGEECKKRWRYVLSYQMVKHMDYLIF